VNDQLLPFAAAARAALAAALLLCVALQICAASDAGGWLKIEHYGESDRPVRPLLLTSLTVFVRQASTVAPLSPSEFDQMMQRLKTEGIGSAHNPQQQEQGTLRWTLQQGGKESVWITGPSDSGRLLQALLGEVPESRPRLRRSVENLVRLTSGP
jgi:hypothetical protein